MATSAELSRGAGDGSFSSDGDSGSDNPHRSSAPSETHDSDDADPSVPRHRGMKPRPSLLSIESAPPDLPSRQVDATQLRKFTKRNSLIENIIHHTRANGGVLESSGDSNEMSGSGRWGDGGGSGGIGPPTEEKLPNDPTGLILWHIFYETVRNSSEIGTPSDVLLKRTTFLVYLALTIPVAIVYAVMYYALNELAATFLALVYAGVALGCVEATVRYELYEYSSTYLKVLCVNPFLVQFALRGVIKAGAVMVWGLLSPVGAALIQSPRKATPYFACHVIMLISSCLFELYGPVPDAQRLEPVDVALFGVQYLAFGTTLFLAASVFSAQFESEKSHSDALLLNVLPAPIADRMKRGEKPPIVDEHDSVTILFADLVGFTEALSVMYPHILIGSFLRDLFFAFDRLIERRGLEKIKTIGDAIMVVGGLGLGGSLGNNEDDEPRRRAHAKQVVQLGMEFQNAVERVNLLHGTRFRLRIGVHTGPVVAGVLGVKKVAFDCWGDAVNRAKLMESSGLPGQVQISMTTYLAIKDMHYFNIEQRRSDDNDDVMRYFVRGCREDTRYSHNMNGPTPNGTTGNNVEGVAGHWQRRTHLQTEEEVGGGGGGSLSPRGYHARQQSLSSIETFVREKSGVLAAYAGGKGQDGWALWRALAVGMSDPDTPPSLLVRRQLFILIWVFSFIMCVFFSPCFVLTGNVLSLAVFWAYNVSSVAVAFFAYRYQCFRFFQRFAGTSMFLITFISPAYLSGGIRHFGNGMIWIFTFPLGSAMFHSPRTAQLWFVVYVASTAFCHARDASLARGELSTTEVVQFAMNNVGAFTVIFTAVHLYATEIQRVYSYSESLLLNALPLSIAKRLRRGEHPIIDNFDDATVLFTDLDRFNDALSSPDMPTDFLIGTVLHDVFLAFDRLVERRDLEKIKTINEEYMVVGGLKETKQGDDAMTAAERSKRNAEQIVLLGMEFQDAVREVNARHGTDFAVRIGVHTGPVIGGVLGVKKFAFDIWGDAVNVASRMKSHGRPGSIHVSAATYSLIKDLDGIRCSSGGESAIKGKGYMKTFFVTGRGSRRRSSRAASQRGSCHEKNKMA